MTLVMIWPNKAEPTAIHIAADSLLSDKFGNRWTFAPKIFRVYPTHAHFAYCGDSAMVLSVITQATAILANTSVLSDDGDPRNPTIGARCRALSNLLEDSVKVCPEAWFQNNTLLYCGFNHQKATFALYEFRLTPAGVDCVEKKLNKHQVSCFGNGAEKALSLLRAGMTMEEILGVLKSVINDPSVPSVDGVPQMTTLSKKACQAAGFNWTINGKVESTLFGLPLHFHSSMEKVRFLDESFRPAKYLRDPRIRRVSSREA